MTKIKQRLFALILLFAGFKLCFPLYKQVYDKYSQSDSDCFKHRLEKSREINKSDRLLGNSYNASPRNLASQVGTAVSPDGREIYELTNNGIKVVDPETGQQEYFELPSIFPRLSWGTDIAYDSKRDLVSLVSLGGEGFLYRFDAKQNKWLDVYSLNNLDIQSLTYDRTLDRYFAWANGNLLTISGTGYLLSQKQIMDEMTGFERLYDRGNEPVPVVEIAANGNDLTLISYSGSSIHSIWHYDYEAKTAQLTYQSY